MRLAVRNLALGQGSDWRRPARARRDGDAGVMGHASITITITLDRYGHLFPGAEDEAAALFDAYLDRARNRPVGKSWGSSSAEIAVSGGSQPIGPESAARH